MQEKRRWVEVKEQAREELEAKRRTKLEQLDEWLAAVKKKLVQEDARQTNPKTYASWEEDIGHAVKVVWGLSYEQDFGANFVLGNPGGVPREKLRGMSQQTAGGWQTSIWWGADA